MEPGTATIETIARPLVVGAGQDPVAYAKFRLDHIARHIAHHGESIGEQWWHDVRAETYALLHTLRNHGAISIDEEWAYLLKVIARIRPEGD